MARYETYLHYAAAILTEWEQARDEGRDVRRFLPEVQRLSKAAWTPEIEREAVALGEEMAKEPVPADYPFEEPSGLEAIRAARPDGGRAFAPAAADEKRILAAWQGRVAGCLLGKPVEGHSTGLFHHREMLLVRQSIQSKSRHHLLGFTT